MILDLGAQPPSNSFLSPEDIDRGETRYPLELLYCPSCQLLQLSYSLDPAEIFTNYVYVSSTSPVHCSHLAEMARYLYNFMNPQKEDLAIDIGSNDGALLKGYEGCEVRILGIEPSSVAEIARKRGIPVHKAFFSERTARDVVEQNGLAKIISAANVFAHVSDHDDFLKGIQALLRDDGIFVIEVPHALDMLDKRLFDTIYHEHIFYFSVHALEDILERRGFRIFRIEKFEMSPSGPPIRVFVCKRNGAFREEDSVRHQKEEELRKGLTDIAVYKKFAERVWNVKAELLNVLEDLKGKGEKILGYGAPAKGNTLLNTFGIGRHWLDVILEKNDLKFGLLTPGTHIPIVDEDTFDVSGYHYALLLSWNLVDEFLKKSPFIKKGGKFIVPLPEPKIVPGED
ncbi:class I SAM-dependent methyltransferase [Nitrospinae bacterium AH_259_B05_G02_I21]|nr:class I SAM-dependent methyltransferase [Nitrospinae bacterium AH_259_B05_G02_I21]MDA2932522.1 class I SAM-dependent methyltransferase [Nitrospinae bacterium AH-259-F20]